MTNPQNLRRQGFRSFPDGAHSEFLERRAANYGYKVVRLGSTLWLRRRHRRQDGNSQDAFILGPTVTRTIYPAQEIASFLDAYCSSTFADIQSRIQSTTEDLIQAISWFDEPDEPYRQLHSLVMPLSFCPPTQLRNILTEHVLPRFFRFDPDGRVRFIQLSEEIEHFFGFLRGNYALRHADIEALRRTEAGIATLRQWEQATPTDYLDSLLSLLQVWTYPFIPLFHGGPLGLSVVFEFSRPQEHQPVRFPRSWLTWARSDALFGRQAVDAMNALTDPESPAFVHLTHNRSRLDSQIPSADCDELLLWSLQRLGLLLVELSDAANFINSAGSIDFTFAFEHNLTFLRVLKRALMAASTEEMPTAKLLPFEVADLFDTLAMVHRGSRPLELFKLLFTPGAATALITEATTSVPPGARRVISEIARSTYSELRQTVLESVWLPELRTDAGVRVKTPDLRGETLEDPDVFVSNVMRALRNSTHGYMSHTDRSQRPSRYLAITTGEVPDSLSALPVVWWFALLADPIRLVGWNPLTPIVANSGPED